ncbi:MAG: hypothetical protein K0Q59_5058 [Paenibacillus sp.]|jgi:hypothetical protein|nr:hypothetical protein [Paenibacillus sp.]
MMSKRRFKRRHPLETRYRMDPYGVYRLEQSLKRDIIFEGPTVDGADAEYVKVASGAVSNRKPSFAR